MEDGSTPPQPKDDWHTRLLLVREENQALYSFVDALKKNGRIPRETSAACFEASVAVMHAGGIIQPQLSGKGLDEETLCAVGAQANHAFRTNLLRMNPELRTELEQIVRTAQQRFR